MKMIKDIRFWVCVIGIVILGFLSGLLSGSENILFFTFHHLPPSWIFGPMWTLLYILMGISLCLLLIRNNKTAKQSCRSFVIQFIFNFIWSTIFNLRNIFIAAIDITLLVIFLSVLMYQLWLHHRLAMWLMIPYYLWVLFATLLNYSIYF